MGTRRTSVRSTSTRIVAILATMIRIIGLLAAVILVAYIVLRLGEANPASGITKFVADWADRLQLGFRGLFSPADDRVRIAVNYGLAALVWLVATSVIASVLRRFA